MSTPTGAYVGIGLAALITATLLTIQLTRRRHYRPGSGHRDTPPAPIVRALRLTHDHATTPTDADGNPTPPDPPHTTPTRRDTATRARARDTATTVLPPGETVLAVHDGQPIALDLARTRGLGLTGPGAPTAARALLISLLAQANQQPSTGAGSDIEILIPAPDVPTLLGDAPLHHPPARLRIVTDLDAALNLLEAELLTRARRTSLGQHPAAPTLTLLATPRQESAQRLQNVLDNGSTLGLAGILLGPWRPGATAKINTDGTVEATTSELPPTLTGTRMFTLPAADTTDLLDLLGTADGLTADELPDDNTPDHTANDVTRTQEPDGTPHITAPLALNGRQQSSAPRPKPSGDLAAGEPAPRTGLSARPAPRHPASDHVGTQAVAIQEHSDPTTDLAVAPPPTAASVAFTVLGRLHLIHRDEDLITHLAPKQREILLFLAVHSGGTRRDTLTATLWPNAHTTRPANTFHATMSQMRRALQSASGNQVADLTINYDGRYALNPDLVTVDLWQLRHHLDTHRTNPDQHLAAFDHVINLYHGDLAEELTTEWLEAPREALRRDVLDYLSNLAHHITPHDPEQALHILERARQLDPYNEPIYHDIARIQAQLGHHAAIKRTLTLLTAHLAELDEKPTPATITLYQQLQEPTTHKTKRAIPGLHVPTPSGTDPSRRL